MVINILGGLANDPSEKILLPKNAEQSSVELFNANDANERNEARKG